MKPDDIYSSYNNWHSNIEFDAECDTLWHNKLKSLLRPKEDLAGKKLLEIGSGRGGFACWLARHPARPERVCAADFSLVAVEMGKANAEKMGIDNISWSTGDIQAIAFPDNHFDTVISCETIEHVPDPALAVKELARVLKPGGRLYLTTPNYFNAFGLYRIYLAMKGTPYTEGGQPYNKFVMVPNTLRWIKNAGLKKLEFGTMEFLVPFPGRVPIRFKDESIPSPVRKLHGLQSYFVAEKPANGR